MSTMPVARSTSSQLTASASPMRTPVASIHSHRSADVPHRIRGNSAMSHGKAERPRHYGPSELCCCRSAAQLERLDELIDAGNRDLPEPQLAFDNGR